MVYAKSVHAENVPVLYVSAVSDCHTRDAVRDPDSGKDRSCCTGEPRHHGNPIMKQKPLSGAERGFSAVLMMQNCLLSGYPRISGSSSMPDTFHPKAAH